MSDLPDPLVPADVDLRGFPGFMLDVERLLASELVALGTADECWYALMLWCRAWQQIPPASLPNDDRVLAAFSRAGSKWKKVREIALRGFVLCSDGRLYHRVLSEEAKTAWDKRKKYQERSAKANGKRWSKDGTKDSKDDPTRIEQGILQGEQKDSLRPPVEVDVEVTDKPTVPNGTGADAPGELSAEEAIFKIAVPWLVERGVADKNARSLMGAARKQLKDEGAWELAQQFMREKPVEPAAWISAAINSRMKPKKVNRHGGFADQDYRAGVADDGSF